MKRISAILDQNSNGLVGLNYSDFNNTLVLAAGVAKVHAVPAGAKYVLFSATADFYARFGAAASVPVADVTDGTGSILNPQLRAIEGATTIGIISPMACIVAMEFYS